MKQMITSELSAHYGKSPRFDKTWGVQLQTIFEELGYKVEMGEKTTWSTGTYNIPVKVNGIPLYIEGDSGSVLKIRCEGMYGGRRSYETSATIFVNKNINLKKFKENFEQAVKEYKNKLTKRQSESDKASFFQELIEFANTKTEFGFKIVNEDSSSFISYGTLKIREINDKPNWDVSKLTINSQFEIVGTSLPQSYVSHSYITFESFDRMTEHISKMKALAEKAKPFIEELKAFSNNQ